MTDTSTAVDVAGWRDQARCRDALAAKILPLNKSTLFDALAAAGIASVIVNFDGYGDSGQIESIEAFDAGQVVIALPDAEIEIRWPSYEGLTIESQAMSIHDAIEHLAYDFLGETHGGWQDGEGAYGDFCFDVAGRTITLDFNERYTAYESYEHSF